MRCSKLALTLACLAMLPSCGGGGGGGGGVAAAPTPTPVPTPTPTTAACSFTSRAAFVSDTLDEWYLFPSLLASPSASNFNDLNAYIDALVAPARAQNKDRFFTYVTSIAEENAFFQGGASAGFGFRLNYDTAARRVFVLETFENTAALGANMDRGTELLAIGTSSNNLQTVASLIASGGAFAVFNALGPPDPGVIRVFRIRDQAGVEREVSIAKTEFALDPVSDRYGASVIDDGGKQVGYINLRTFIDPAAQDLRDAFLNFRDQGITELIIDFRYNGGGALSISDLMGDLLGRNLDGQIYYELAFRNSKSQFNEIYRFNARAQSVGPTKIAFIGTGDTASASELVINGMQPYLGQNMALIGSNTFGKPVGQSAFDLAACDDRLRSLTYQLQNADGNGEYFNGLAATIGQTCRASDDLSFQLGDPREAMVATALDFLAGRPCAAIGSGADGAIASTQRTGSGQSGLLVGERPRSVAEREVPGLN